MLIFCDESWRQSRDGKKVGTLAAIAIPEKDYNDIDYRLFALKAKYFGPENSEREVKGKSLLSNYEFRREANEKVISIKLSFANDLLEELRVRRVTVFGSIVTTSNEVDLLCEDSERFDRPYKYLMERVHEYLMQQANGSAGSLIFDDRGIVLNQRVATAFRNFLAKSKMGQSFATLVRSANFAYSQTSAGLQLADLVCTVIARYHTDKDASWRVPHFYQIVKDLEFRSRERGIDGFFHSGIKIVGEKSK